MIRPETVVRELVVQHPQTLRVFEKHGIDYCCGGAKPLSVAAQDGGVEMDQLVADLKRAVSEPPAPDAAERDWSQASQDELIDFIVETHHAFMKSETPRVAALLTTVIGAHGARHGEVLTPLGELYETVKADIAAHLQWEEDKLFPAIGKAESLAPGTGENDLRAQIDQTVAEHETLGEALDGIRKLTTNFALPADACPTFAALYDGLQGLEHDLHRHIHLENNVLFPRALASEGA